MTPRGGDSPPDEGSEPLEPTPVRELLARVASRAPMKPPPAESVTAATVVRPASPDPHVDLAGASRLVEEGWAPVLVSGPPRSGKTSLLAAAATGPFGLGDVDAARRGLVPVRRGRRRRALVEMAAAEWKALTTREPGRLLTGLGGRWVGLIVLIDLASPDLQADLAEARGLLVRLRWSRRRGHTSRSGGELESWPGLEVATRQVLGRGRRLTFPVHVVFSRADRLIGRPVGSHRPGLFPAGEHPLLLAHHLVPELVAALRDHAQRFRFEFAHCRVESDSGLVLENRPCGVDGLLDGLLGESGRGRPWGLSTASWIDLRRAWDGFRGRDRRWHALTPPRSLL